MRASLLGARMVESLISLQSYANWSLEQRNKIDLREERLRWLNGSLVLALSSGRVSRTDSFVKVIVQYNLMSYEQLYTRTRLWRGRLASRHVE